MSAIAVFVGGPTRTVLLLLSNLVVVSISWHFRPFVSPLENRLEILSLSALLFNAVAFSDTMAGTDTELRDLPLLTIVKAFCLIAPAAIIGMSTISKPLRRVWRLLRRRCQSMKAHDR